MFRGAYQSGFLSILYALGSKPLELWSVKLTDGSLERVRDEETGSGCIDLLGRNVSTASISCPAEDRRTLGIRLPILGLLVKNLDEHVSVEVAVREEGGTVRRIRASTSCRRLRTAPFATTVPLSLARGWNRVTFDLPDLLRRAYGTTYAETLRVTLHASCRVRRIYFCDRHYGEGEIPSEFKLFLPKRGHAAVAPPPA